MDVARPEEHRVFAALYDRMTGPLEHGVLAERRAGLLADLTGRVLDVGAGTGANLPHLRSASRVVAAEPDPAMRWRMAAKLAGAPVPAEIRATSPRRCSSRTLASTPWCSPRCCARSATRAGRSPKRGECCGPAAG
jgi:hypothetical protein